MDIPNNSINSNSYKFNDKERVLSAPEMIQESKRIKEFNQRTPNAVKLLLEGVSK